MNPLLDIDWKVLLTAIVPSILTGFVVWAKASRTRAIVSGDSLQVQENESRGKWIGDLEKQIADERNLRINAENRERATFALHIEDQREIGELKTIVKTLMQKITSMDRRIDLISELLVIERPDMLAVVNMFKASAMAEPDLASRT